MIKIVNELQFTKKSKIIIATVIGLTCFISGYATKANLHRNNNESITIPAPTGADDTYTKVQMQNIKQLTDQNLLHNMELKKGTYIPVINGIQYTSPTGQKMMAVKYGNFENAYISYINYKAQGNTDKAVSEFAALNFQYPSSDLNVQQNKNRIGLLESTKILGSVMTGGSVLNFDKYNIDKNGTNGWYKVPLKKGCYILINKQIAAEINGFDNNK